MAKNQHFFRIGFIVDPATAHANLTGSWRTLTKPKFYQKACIACDICFDSCPEGIIYHKITDVKKEMRNTYWADYRYCKGCGICAEVCPVENEIVMVPEAEEI
jgi:2-oxoacid:acceptor oxidoreductase delta subunit (pyruvate/2-ketoisovalerate family)